MKRRLSTLVALMMVLLLINVKVLAEDDMLLIERYPQLIMIGEVVVDEDSVIVSTEYFSGGNDGIHQ